MARVTVEDCLRHVANRFELVVLAAKRTRQLTAGMPATVPWNNDKPTVVALREIGENSINIEELILDEPVVSRRNEVARGMDARAFMAEESRVLGVSHEEDEPDDGLLPVGDAEMMEELVDDPSVER